MALNSLEIACADCGKKRRFIGRQIEMKEKFVWTCSGCGTKSTVTNDLPKATKILEEKAAKLLGADKTIKIKL